MKCELFEKNGQLIGILENNNSPVITIDSSRLKSWSLSGYIEGVQPQALFGLVNKEVEAVIHTSKGDCKGGCFATNVNMDGYVNITGTGALLGEEDAIFELMV